MSEAEIDAVARALQAEAEKFNDPVSAYVDNEASRRWNAENPGKDYLTDGPNIDWRFESWKILARAALRTLSR